MTWLHENKRLNAIFLLTLFASAFQGAHSQLTVSPAGPTLVNAIAGRNVTLAVSFTGASDPAVAWSMINQQNNLQVVTWVINSTFPPDIPESRRNVLKLEQDGSLTFMKVPLEYTTNYTFEITKSGVGRVSTTFILRVFEIIQNVTLSADRDPVIEGTDRFTLEYNMLQGVVEQQTWLFNGREIKTNSHYSAVNNSLVIWGPTRGDTGQYSVLLTNPFSNVTTHINIRVLYGPDEPKVVAHPAQPFYVSGDSLNLSCQGEGFPKPVAQWLFGGQNISGSEVLNLTNVRTTQGGVYTCRLLNEQTKKEQQKNITLNIYKRPSGSPVCSVQSVNNNNGLQYLCQWSGGTPQANLYFPVLSNSSSGSENFSLTVSASENLDGKTVTCLAEHPIEKNKCNITASSPRKFLPSVRTMVGSEGKIVVSIHCVSEASPKAVVSWFRGSQGVTNGTTHQISNDTSQIQTRDFNVSNLISENYTCTSRNPLGSQRREVQLTGPSISDSSLFPNQDGTIVTLTWEVPPYSLVTGFDIQMKGPDLLSENQNGTRTKGNSDRFKTIQQKPGPARSADIFVLDPKLTYRFRVIPKARLTEGEPSEVHRIGPGEGLSGPAIAGIAAGIPCSILFLILLAVLIYLCVDWHRKRSRQTRYPVSRAVEKAITTQIDSTPQNLLTGRLKSPPDYNKLNLTPSERSVALPSFVPPPPTRVATTV
ncbi:V-set and immunoglobulin domain-containing protein 10-like [Cheilinus undulatus]|uniref:V-set and immunoglobulin domain-containing protein 10-like n=1 Tax=Cheilinus undulatus TaxID=241271 RepID=UPI001BD40DDA|nr:V-set and immunoglobulin domain-containing protein 10-like [Cheilinus undulatus]